MMDQSIENNTAVYTKKKIHMHVACQFTLKQLCIHGISLCHKTE